MFHEILRTSWSGIRVCDAISGRFLGPLTDLLAAVACLLLLAGRGLSGGFWDFQPSLAVGLLLFSLSLGFAQVPRRIPLLLQ